MHRLPNLPLLALAILPALAGAECRYSAERNFDVPATGLAAVSFNLGSSDLVVEGVPGLATVEVRGRACASDQAWLDRLTVDQHRSGDTLEIVPHDGHDLHGGSFGSNYAYVELHVRVPSRLAAKVTSDSGDARARNLAALDFDSSSGDLEADQIDGPLTIEVSSGDVRGEDIGSVDVRGTSSGDIKLRDVHGAAVVARSGSGDLAFSRVGSVRIDSVGSGDVWVADATGDVDIDSIGSGDVDVNGVGGTFHVGARGSGDIHYRDVRGTVSVPSDDD